MSDTLKQLSKPIIKSNILSEKELKFIESYLTYGNATQAVLDAGYKTQQPSRYASDLLRKEKISQEISRQISERDAKKIAAPPRFCSFTRLSCVARYWTSLVLRHPLILE